MPHFSDLGFYRSLSTCLFAGAVLCTVQISSDLKAEGVAWQPLARFTVDELPPAPMFVALTRVTYDSRAAQPSQSRPGSVLEYVESGRMELEATGDLTVLRGPPGTTSQRETIDQGTSITLSPGGLILL